MGLLNLQKLEVPLEIYYQLLSLETMVLKGKILNLRLVKKVSQNYLTMMETLMYMKLEV